MIIIYQGDQFPISFSIENEDGTNVTDEDISEMIFLIGDDITKKFTDGDITYDSETEKFTVWIQSKDTSPLLIKPYESQLTVYFNNDYVLTFDCGQLLVKELLGSDGDE